jgi:S1-C subfamily serine protease
MRVSFGFVLASVWVFGPAPRATAEELDSAALYERCVRSSVFVACPRKDGHQTGTGTLIDADRRLVLTSAQVVGSGPVFCQFPVRAKDGGLVTDQRKYLDRISSGQALKGTVLHRDESRDLALVELDRLPPDTSALPLAKTSPRPGERVMSIGNPGKLYSLFSTTEAAVRAVDVREVAGGGDGAKRVKVRLLTLTNPRSPGDPGGLWIDRKGHLVGVEASWIIDGPQNVNRAIDVTEVRAFLADHTVKVPELETGPKK